MFINKLELFDYRGITHLELQFKPGVNLIVGVNGMGKSSILDALAILMSGFIRRVENAEKKSRKFVESDIANDNSAMMTSIELTYEDEIIKWSAARKSNKNIKNRVADALYRSELNELNEVTNKIHERVVNKFINRDSALSLPIAVAYDVNRAVVEPPVRVRGGAETELFDVYDQALEQKSGADFDGFFKWFRKLEDIENEKIRDDPQYRNEQLNTVRQAIELFIPGFKKLRIRRSPLRMTVEKNGTVFNIKQLSDGEKCLIAMVGDIARRLAMANPSSVNALEGQGVILIDEVDLHLHPSWQRMVIDQLSSTFPNCQFILSTHSPQIIGHVKPGAVWLLSSENGDVTAVQPENTFGMDSNLILELIMEVPERESGVKTKLMDLFKSINEGDSDMTQKILSDIIQIAGYLPELNRAKALIKRKELLGR